MAGGSCPELEAFDLRQRLAGQEGPARRVLGSCRVTMTSRLSGAQAGIPGETGGMVNRAHAAKPSPPLPTVLGFEGSFHDAHATGSQAPRGGAEVDYPSPTGLSLAPRAAGLSLCGHPVMENSC